MSIQTTTISPHGRPYCPECGRELWQLKLGVAIAQTPWKCQQCDDIYDVFNPTIEGLHAIQRQG